MGPPWAEAPGAWATPVIAPGSVGGRAGIPTGVLGPGRARGGSHLWAPARAAWGLWLLGSAGPAVRASYPDWALCPPGQRRGALGRPAGCPTAAPAMPSWLWGLLLTAGTLSAALSPGPPAPADPCHDEGGAPRGCVPGLVNAALGREVLASSTCGRPATQACNASDPRRAHPAALLTSAGGTASPVCWRSDSLTQAPLNVTLTVPLGKAFELVFVSLRFCSTPPTSVALLKSQDHGHSWAPLGFFSSRCGLDYGRLPAPTDGPGGPGPEALCFPEPQAQPDGGGLLAFSVQDGSPPGLDLDSSPVLQDWVTATDIRVVLTRPAMLGYTRDSAAMAPYAYSATELQVGGRCKCNGHASQCLQDTQGHLICDCRHGTEGADCSRCKPFYCDRPWQRATAWEAHACLGEALRVAWGSWTGPARP